VSDQAPSPLEESESREKSISLRTALEQLPSRQRNVVYLRYFADESLEGIAAVLNCSVGTVKSRLFHTLERLAKMKEVRDILEEWR